MRSAIEHYLNRTGFSRLEPRAALFDMDGTLYDSMPHHADAWLALTQMIGLPAERDEFFLYEGRTGTSTINVLFQRAYGHGVTDEEARRLYGIKSDLFKAMPPVDPMPGAAALLRQVMEAGMRRVLVTGSGQSTLLSRLDADFPGAFPAEMRITAANTTHSKPHPDPYLKAMALALVQPWQSIAFENAPLGVESASRSGAFTIAIATGPIPLSTLSDAGADIAFPSMSALAAAFPTLLSQLTPEL